MICPLCQRKETELYDQDKQRSFMQCLGCNLVFVPRHELISETKEFDRYRAHENAEENEGYHFYLAGIRNQIIPHLSPHSRGLDFGSGKTKLLEHLLRERGHDVLSYDVYFYPESPYKKDKYDFIVLSEVIEHLRNPLETMSELKLLLDTRGKMFIKTRLLPVKREEFKDWFYKRDITHVQFFSERSFEVLSKSLNIGKAKFLGDDLYLFSNDG
jgi:Methyltransferase domain